MARNLLLLLALLSLSCTSALPNGLALTPPRGFSTWDQWPDQMKPASGHSVTEAQSVKYMHGMVASGLNKLNYVSQVAFGPEQVSLDALSLTSSVCFVGSDLLHHRRTLLHWT